MEQNGFFKTHYELAVDFVDQNKIFGIIGFKDFVRAMEEDCGKDPDFMDFAKMKLVSAYLSEVGGTQSAVIVSNVLYHIYCLYQHYEKIYYVCPDLALKLARTDLNVDTRFLKAPFPELFIQVDPGLFHICNPLDDEEVPVRGFYVHTRELGEVKEVRIMVAAMSHGCRELSDNSDDSLFFFKVYLGDGKIKEVFEEYLTKEIERNEEDLKMYGGGKNMHHIRELFYFVFNLLLYVSSKEPDIINQLPYDFEGAAAAKKNPSKARKILKRAQKHTALPILVVGKNTGPMANADDIRKSGGVGKWKLSKRVYVSGYWREQWYGSKKEDNRHTKLIHIEPYEKGPDAAEVVRGRKYKVGKS